MTRVSSLGLGKVAGFHLLMAFILLGLARPAWAIDADGFVFPVLGSNQTDPARNTSRPAGWVMTQGFGASLVLPGGHLGEDWALPGNSTAGQKVYAVANGVVKAVFTTGSSTDSWGPVIIIEHTVPAGLNTTSSILALDMATTQTSPTTVYSLYAHLKQGSLKRLDGDNSELAAGSVVRKGEAIAQLGTGYVDHKWKAHLHFEIRSEPADSKGYGYSGTDKSAPKHYSPSVLIANNTVLNKGLIKLDGGGTVYWLQNGKKYPVAGPSIIDTMQAAGLPNWAWGKVATVNDVARYETGPSILTASTASDTLLIRDVSSKRIYAVSNGLKVYQSSLASQASFADVIDLAASFFSQETRGTFTVGQSAPSSAIQQAFSATHTANAASLGLATDSVKATTSSTGVSGYYQTFDNGSIQYMASGSQAGSTYAVYGAVYDKWASQGYGASPLGLPTANQVTAFTSSQGTTGYYQSFEGGSIQVNIKDNISSPYAVYGKVYDKWGQLGYATGALGLPVGDRVDNVRSGFGSTGYYQRFENGAIEVIGVNAFAVSGVVYGEWGQHGYAGKYIPGDDTDTGQGTWAGFPLSDAYAASGKTRQDFEGGYILADNSGAQFVSDKHPAGLSAVSNGSSIQLSWQNRITAAGVNIYRSGSPTELIASLAGTATSYADSSAVSGHAYTYYLTTLNETAESPASNLVSQAIQASGQDTLSVIRGGAGTGTVASADGGIDCGQDCSEVYTVGATVTLSAQPATGSAFSGWSGACSGASLTCTVTLNAAATATATFASQAASGFQGNNDGTVTDAVTGLIWQQQDDDVTRSWEGALSYCEGLTLAGQTDWRLPDYMELASITDDTHYNPAIDSTVFPGTNSSYYWSSTSYAYDSSYAWIVYFFFGSVNYFSKTFSYYVRCVRSGAVSWPFDHLVSIAGTITNGAGSLPRAGVLVSTAGGASTVSDDQGHYALTLPPGATTLSFSKSGYQAVTKAATVVAGQSTTVDAALVVPISGLAKDMAGSPLAGVTVATTGASTTTVADGSYELGSLSAGTYTVIFSKSGYQTITRSGVAVVAGQETALDVTLPVSLAGTVRDFSSGAAISGVTVATTGASTASATNGSYALGSLNPGVYDVTFSKSGYQTTTVSGVTVLAGQGTVRDMYISPPGILNITTTSLPPAERGKAYNSRTGISGGVWPFTFSVSSYSGPLPPGLSLDAAFGNISGSPTAVGSYTFAILVTDKLGTQAEKEFTVVVTEPLAMVTAPAFVRGTRGTGYQGAIQAQGGSQPYTFSVTSGSLPPGMLIGDNGTLVSSGSSGNIASLAGALDNPTRLAVTSGGNANWGVDTSTSSSGGSSARSGSIGHNSSTWMETTVVGPTTLAFQWKVSSESGYDYLTLTIDGSTQNRISGSTGWASQSYAIGAGTHTVRWNYSKDGSATGGSDCAWVDQVTMTPNNNGVTGTVLPVPTAAGSYAFTVRVADSLGRSVDKAFTMDIIEPLAHTTSRLNDGVTGTAYTQPLTASGGYGAKTFGVYAGALPEGLALDAASGTISGTPTLATRSPVVFFVSDEDDRVSYKDFTITVAEPLAIKTASMPNGLLNDSYAEAIRLAGGVEPFTFAYSGQLPAGLSLNTATGVISGTPTTAGLTNVSITVTDSTWPTAQTRTQNLAIRIISAMTITTSAVLPNAKSDVAMNQVLLVAKGGTSPYQWSLSAGHLPEGVTLNPVSGQLTGTPADKGDFAFTVTAVDSGATQKTAQKEFFLHISGPLSLLSGAVPDGAKDMPYSATLNASGGLPAYAWRVKSGTLPTGLTLNSATGTISGTPTTKQTFSFTVEVSDRDSPAQTAEQTFIIDVVDTLVIQSRTLPNARIDVPYTATARAQLGTAPYTWRLASGVLPPGLTLTPSPTVATLTGTPTVAGSFTFELEVSDQSTPVQRKTQQYTIVVYTDVKITSAGLKTATRGEPYSDTVQVRGGGLPYSFTVTRGSLPLWIGLNSTSGRISGTTPPVTGESAAFTIRATDSANPSDYAEKEFSIFVVDPLAITTETIQGALQKSFYQATLAGNGGFSPYQWSIAAGSLPAGLGLDAASGVISGTARECGPSSFTVRLSDAAPLPTTISKAFTLAVTCSNDYDLAGQVGTLGGVRLDLSGPQTASATSDDSGAFKFQHLTNGTYTVTPTKYQYWFEPASRTMAANNLDLAGVDFVAHADSTPPVVGITINGGGNTLTKNAQFNQTATATDAASMTYAWSKQSGPGTVTFGTASALNTSIVASVDGTYTVRFTATDAAGNSAYSEMTLLWDTTPPTLNVDSPSQTITRGGPITYSVTYQDADAIDLTAATISLLKTGTANGTVSVTGSGNTARTVTISSITGDGTLGISLAAGTGSDIAGNTSAATGPSGTVTVDNTLPLVSAGSNQTKKEVFTQTATASDANAMSYSWNMQTGPGTVSFGTADALATTITPSLDGIYTLRFTAIDAAGNSVASDMTLVWDTTPPAITGVTSSTANGAYKAGSVIDITVNFSEAVTSTGLTIALDSGASITTGALNNQTSWSGSYTVVAGQTSGDLTVSSITGTISDAATNSTANPVIPAGSNLADSKAIIIDTTAPVVSAGEIQIKNASFTQTGTATDANPMIYSWAKQSGPGAITFGTLNGIATSISTTIDGNYVLRLTATDAAGNSAASDMALVWDTTPPTLGIGGPSATLTKGGPISYTVTYQGADAVDVPEASVIVNKSGTVNGIVAVSGAGNATRTVTISSITGDGTLGISLAAGTGSDLAGNTSAAAGPSGTFTVDNTPPVVSAGSNQTKNSQFTQTASATDTSAMTYAWSQQSGTGTVSFGTQNALVTTMAASLDGTYTLRFTATDAAGNSTASDMTLVWDTTPPTISGVTSGTANGAYKAGSVIDITVNFSEAVTSTGLAIALDSGASVSTGALNNQTSWIGSYTVAAGQTSGDLTVSSISGLISDAATNSSANPVIPVESNLADSKAIIIDTTAPVVSAGDIQTRNALFTQTGAASDANPMTYAWVMQSGPGAISFGSPNAIATTVTADLDGVYVLRLTATDAAGNSAASDVALLWDTIAPAIREISSSTDSGAYRAGAEIALVIDFTEAVTSPSLSIELNSGGRFSTGPLRDQASWSGSYTVASGHNSEHLNASAIIGIIRDAADNSAVNPAIPAAGNIGDSNALVIDTTAPTVTASPAGGTYLAAQVVTLTADEAATIYFTADGTAPTVKSAEYDWPIAISATGELKFLAKDAAGNESEVTSANYVINKGDLNNDGRIDLIDAIIAVRAMAGMAPAHTVHLQADVDGDGRIGLPEVIYIMRSNGLGGVAVSQ